MRPSTSPRRREQRHKVTKRAGGADLAGEPRRCSALRSVPRALSSRRPLPWVTAMRHAPSTLHFSHAFRSPLPAGAIEWEELPSLAQRVRQRAGRARHRAVGRDPPRRARERRPSRHRFASSRASRSARSTSPTCSATSSAAEPAPLALLAAATRSGRDLAPRARAACFLRREPPMTPPADLAPPPRRPRLFWEDFPVGQVREFGAPHSHPRRGTGVRARVRSAAVPSRRRRRRSVALRPPRRERLAHLRDRRCA